MLRTIEVEIDSNGLIHSLEPSTIIPAGHALLTILTPQTNDALLLAEQALAEDWLRPEEDEAWAYLQPDK